MVILFLRKALYPRIILKRTFSAKSPCKATCVGQELCVLEDKYIFNSSQTSLLYCHINILQFHVLRKHLLRSCYFYLQNPWCHTWQQSRLCEEALAMDTVWRTERRFRLLNKLFTIYLQTLHFYLRSKSLKPKTSKQICCINFDRI